MKNILFKLKIFALVLISVVCCKFFFELGYSNFKYSWKKYGHVQDIIRGTNPDANVSVMVPPCKPKKNIAFSKLHKCGSSTVLNILLRYGDMNNLTFVLPPSGNYLGWPMPFDKRKAMRVPWNEYNIFAHHSRFSYEGISAIMAPGTVYVTCLREPVSLFESSFTYFNFGNSFGLKDLDLKEFADGIEKYYRKSRNARLLNPMLFDLGMNSEDMWNVTNIDNKIKYLDKTFNFIMIAEYMDESLVLLKESMCWNTDDIVAFSMNTRSAKSKSNITEEVAKKVVKWNVGDVKLYDHFNRTLWKRIGSFGSERMQKELAELKSRREYYSNHCIDGVITNDPKVWRPNTVSVQSLQIKPSAKNNTMCVGLTRTELPFTDYVRKKQLQNVRNYNIAHASNLTKNTVGGDIKTAK
ncbi:galactosylceramide sulfotransferase-like [Glandiceps talaboti]